MAHLNKCVSRDPRIHIDKVILVSEMYSKKKKKKRSKNIIHLTLYIYVLLYYVNSYL